MSEDYSAIMGSSVRIVSDVTTFLKTDNTDCLTIRHYSSGLSILDNVQTGESITSVTNKGYVDESVENVRMKWQDF